MNGPKEAERAVPLSGMESTYKIEKPTHIISSQEN